jgi:hypothetical protein
MVAMGVLAYVLVRSRSCGSTAYQAEAAQLRWPIPAGDSAVAKDLLAKNYYVVLDESGSMKDSNCSGGASKEVAAKAALAAFLDKLPKGANLGFLSFDASGITERVPLGRGQKQAFLAALAACNAGGGTPLRSAIELGLEKLAAQAGRQLGYGDYDLVVVTDGLASEGEDPSAVVGFIAEHTPVILHTIGFCISGDHPLKRPGVVYYREANDPKELAQGLDEVLAEEKEFPVSQFQK